MLRLHRLFSKPVMPPPKPLSESAKEVLTSVDEVKESSEKVNELLKPYMDMPDPFGAFFSARWTSRQFRDRQ